MIRDMAMCIVARQELWAALMPICCQAVLHGLTLTKAAHAGEGGSRGPSRGQLLADAQHAAGGRRTPGAAGGPHRRAAPAGALRGA